jgi:hypothetical protein
MAQTYIYFAGTLPMLFFGEKPALSIETFDADAARLTSAKTAELLKKATLYNPEAVELPSAVRKFYAWENALRNSWLEFRKKFRSDAGDFKRNNPDYYSDIAPVLTQAANCTDLLEAEKIIDRLRWSMLDSFCAGHYNDVDFLAIYRIKLQILAKYEVRTAENGNRALEDILQNLLDANKTN